VVPYNGEKINGNLC